MAIKITIMKEKSITSLDYLKFVLELKSRIQSARVLAARAVNRDLILLYWDIGRGIVEKQKMLGWGESVIDRISSDLHAAFPESRGFSSRNLRDMKRFYLTYKDSTFWRQTAAKFVVETKMNDSELRRQAVAKIDETMGGQERFLQQLVAEIPWGHHLLILNKITIPAARLYYLRATVQLGWSRNVLLNQIKAQAYERAKEEKKTHNFPNVLPEYLAEQAEETLKSSYNLEFLGISREMRERELENRLIEKLKEFILELGYGFCFIGRQYRLTLEQKEYFIDLLFYHRFLKSLVAIELKVGPFEPEFTGKMDFYLNLLNAKERAPGDNSSIGIILCAEKNDIEVEFALKTKANPIGVAKYQLQPRLPAKFKGKLPSEKQLTEMVREIFPENLLHKKETHP